MVDVSFKLITVTRMEHPSNFSLAVPSFLSLQELSCRVAEHYYQVASCAY
jgi:hypothetical protein